MTTTTTNRFYVYAYLRKDGSPYYIGKGQGKRIDCSQRRTTKLPPKDQRKILVGGLTEPEALEYEIALIHCLGRKDQGRGCLRNFTDGGEGTSGYAHGPEARAKIGAAMRNPSAETRARRSAANKRRTFAPETRAKLSAAASNPSPETRAKLSAAASNRSAEHRAKLSAAQAGQVHSPKTRAKLSAAHKGRKHSAETRAKVSAASKGRKFSAETRAKLSAATAARHAAKRALREALSGQLSLLLQEVG